MRNKLIEHLENTPTKFNKPLKEVLTSQSIDNIADKLVEDMPYKHCVSCGARIPVESNSHICKNCQDLLSEEDYEKNE